MARKSTVEAVETRVVEPEKPLSDVGVIVGRFQLHELHEAHRSLIDSVVAKHKRVLVFLGVGLVPGTIKNPLDYITRQLMFNETYPQVTVLPLVDVPGDDEQWSKNLDQAIRALVPTATVMLYGSRDSFLPSYRGRFSTTELRQNHYVSATSIRKELSNEVRGSADFRVGVIYSTWNRFRNPMPTVDVAVVNSNRTQVLLARKPHEKLYRFIGGFVDNTDASTEAAGRREVTEEAGIEVDGFEYVWSGPVDDLRYRNEQEKIFTTFYVATHIFGQPQPQDDICELKWFDIQTLKQSDVVGTHYGLLHKFMTHEKKQPVVEDTSFPPFR